MAKKEIKYQNANIKNPLGECKVFLTFLLFAF